jgi:hypothetical protein
MTSIRRIIAVICAAVVVAVSSSSALAGEFNVNSSGSYVQVPPHSTLTSASADGSISPTVVRVRVASHGFDWGDAAIGAAGGIAIVLLLAGAGLSLAQLGRNGIRHA